MASLANPGGTSLTPMGNAAQQQIRGTFTTPAGTIAWSAAKVYLRLSKFGAPADDIQLALTNSADVTQATASIPAGNIARAGWYEFVLSGAMTLAASTLYKLVLSRSGAQDAANYYRVEMDSTQAGDLAQFYNGSWNNFNPAASLIFKVQGEEDTAVQLGRMLGSGNGGQFFSALDLPASSGVVAPMWREGKKTARAEIEPLLQTGSGSLRYLASVDINRRLGVSLMPAAGAADYGLLRNGGLLDPAGIPVPRGTCVAGVWMAAADLAQAALVGPVMADPLRVFVEAMRWDNLRERYRITGPRGAGA